MEKSVLTKYVINGKVSVTRDKVHLKCNKSLCTRE